MEEGDWEDRCVRVQGQRLRQDIKVPVLGHPLPTL